MEVVAQQVVPSSAPASEIHSSRGQPSPLMEASTSQKRKVEEDPQESAPSPTKKARSYLVPAGEKPILQKTNCQTTGFRKQYPEATFCKSCIRKKAGDPCRFNNFRVLALQRGTGFEKTIYFLADSKYEAIRKKQFKKKQPETPTDKEANTDFQEAGTGLAAPDPHAMPTLQALPDGSFEITVPGRQPVRTTLEDERHILHHSAGTMHQFLSREITHAQHPYVHRRTPVPGARHLCDECSTSMFCGYWFCSRCAKEICFDCYDTGDFKTPAKRSHVDFLGRCGKDTLHDKEMFVPIIKMNLEELLAMDAKARRVLEETGEVKRELREPSRIPNDVIVEVDLVGDSKDYTRIPADSTTELATFAKLWETRRPFVYEVAKNRISPDWNPQYFIGKCGSEEVAGVDCSTRLNVPILVGSFFKGFLDEKNRIRSVVGKKPIIMKLPDWPTTGDFADKFPELFENFFQMIPFPSYTSRTGVRNLASRMPLNQVPPDLGPKMYNAYASPNDTASGVGTTPIHLDLSDAFNILVYASSIEDTTTRSEEDHPNESKQKTADETTTPTAANQPTAAEKRPTTSAPKCGAIWDVYHPEDVPELRKFLRKIAAFPVDDPIHDQAFHLTFPMRKRLWEEHGVKAVRIHQNVGDIVFIPGGSVHQVCNMMDCIKVAADFVSAENVGACFQLTSEFRLLSRQHKRREDLLQVRSIVWDAWHASPYFSASDTP